MKTPRKIDASDLPFKKLRSDVDGMFQRFFDDPFFANKLSGRNVTPACNIIEKSDKYIIEVEIPGVEPEDVEIDVESNMLKIKGERQEHSEHEDEETQIHTMEHNYGSFHRSFTLPEGIQEEAISAHNKNGILFIELPKDKEKKARRIEINKD